jgi:hypothetical protein
MPSENWFTRQLASILTRQAQQLEWGVFPHASTGGGFASIAQILTSPEWAARHPWINNGKE